MQERVGFIGLGIMGRAMALNILKKGFPLTVWNRTPEKMEAIAREGAEKGANPADVARKVTVVCTCVGGPDDLLEVVAGPKGLLEGAHQRQGEHGPLLHVDFSTVSPEASQKVARLWEEAGGRFLEAPVTGGEKGAREGTLTIMAGGHEEDFQRALPILEAVGERIHLIGPHGSGQLLKLIGNMIGGIALWGALEGLLLAERGGLPMDQVKEVLTHSSADSASLRLLLQRLESGRYHPGFPLKHRLKDFRLALREGERKGVPLPAAALVTQMYGSAFSMGLGEDDQTAVYPFFKERFLGFHPEEKKAR